MTLPDDVILAWWREEKYEDYMGPAEGFVAELIDALDKAGWVIVRKKDLAAPRTDAAK